MTNDTGEPIDDGENVGSNPSAEPGIGALIARRYSRRGALTAGLALAAAGGSALRTDLALAGRNTPSSLGFQEIAHTYDTTHHVAEGYTVQVLLRWGDPILPDAPSFDVANQSAAAQEQQFGYNCDYIEFRPLPPGSDDATHGLLTVNHEFTSSALMFPGLGAGRTAALKSSRAQAAVEIAAHGVSVVEVRQSGGQWTVVPDSRFNRRLTGDTPMTLSGPAAGHALLRTGADNTGTAVRGTLNNCAGGNTPWGTVLTTEENFNLYFGGHSANLPQAGMYKRYGILPAARYSWPVHFDRFNVEKEPHEPHRFGWIVEFDPYDPASVPVKRTALGRFKHEACQHGVASDGRVVFYMGDDERFEYVYKFVTARPWNRENRAANRDLLNDGTLYVARFADDGTLMWLALGHGQGLLREGNVFRSQAEVLIFARKAADLLQATPMDRPEDVKPNPVTGLVYVVLTNNTQRTADMVDRANPRPANAHGHIIEIANQNNDHAALAGTWSLFLVGGKPGVDAGASYHRATSADGWFSCPDNLAFDRQGRMFIATDGATEAAGVADGLYLTDTTGVGRALTRLFFQAPAGAEVTGPALTPDNQTLFLSVQHPGQDPASSFDSPSTRWPDFQPGIPPRPSVVAITRTGGGVIGS